MTSLSNEVTPRQVSLLQAAKQALEALEQNEFYNFDDDITALRQAIAQAEQQEPAAIELLGVKEAVAEGGGFWHSCSGCYESNEGAPPNGATFSTVFQCYLGCGCDECGGIGAVWDNTDYEDMAQQGTAPPQPKAEQPLSSFDKDSEPVAWKCDHCNIKTPHEHISSGVIKRTAPPQRECKRCEELGADKKTWYRMAERFAIRNEELKSVLQKALNLIEGEWPEGDETAQPVIDVIKTSLANKSKPQRELEDYIETNKALAKEIIDLKNREWVEPSSEQIAKIKGFYSQASFETIARAVLKLAKELNHD